VDPALSPLLDLFPPVDLTTETLPQIRNDLKAEVAQMAAAAPAFPDVEVTEHTVPGPEGAPDVRVLVYIPTRAPRPLPCLLNIHGGGFVLGSAAENAGAKQVAQELPCAVVSVDYRLAPETPHPGPVEDCYAALKWLHAQARALQVDPTRLAIGGGSAGAGLAAALGLLTRDRGEIPLRFQMLLSPMLDDRTGSTADPHPYTGEFMWTPENNRFAWTSLLGRAPGGEDVSPYAAAARAENLEGLPPAYISVGALDLFVEEDIEYARRLIRAGVPTELHVYPGTFHDYSLSPDTWMSQADARNVQEALRRALHDPDGPSTTDPER
jgi:acetyl esterase/lipase